MLDLNGLIGRVLSTGGRLIDTPGKKMLAGGAAAGLLLTDTGRDIAGGALKYGGIAALGALAYHAWQKHKAGEAGTSAPEQTQSLPPPTDTAFVPQEPAAQEGLARLLVAAMINAAKADGQVDSEEQGAILGQADRLKLSDEEKSFLFAEFGKPFDMEPIVREANTPEVAAEVYAASRLAVVQASPAETAYLRTLAQRLRLPDGVVQEIDRTIAASPAGAAA